MGPSMVITSNTVRRDYSPRRAIQFSLGLLLASVVLASSMTMSGPRLEHIQPEGWNLSIESPMGFSRGQAVNRENLELIQFHGHNERGQLLIIVQRFTALAPGTQPTELCDRVVAEILSWGTVRGATARTTPRVTEIGGRPAVEVQLTNPHTLVRACIVGNEGYTISLTSEGVNRLDQDSVLAYSRVCRTARFSN